MRESLTILKGGMLKYRYDIGPDRGFEFHTLAELARPISPGSEKKSGNVALLLNSDVSWMTARM